MPNIVKILSPRVISATVGAFASYTYDTIQTFGISDEIWKHNFDRAYNEATDFFRVCLNFSSYSSGGITEPLFCSVTHPEHFIPRVLIGAVLGIGGYEALTFVVRRFRNVR